VALSIEDAQVIVVERVQEIAEEPWHARVRHRAARRDRLLSVGRDRAGADHDAVEVFVEVAAEAGLGDGNALTARLQDLPPEHERAHT
jgi:hypothetical protein